jgi:hypothetical protein
MKKAVVRETDIDFTSWYGFVENVTESFGKELVSQNRLVEAALFCMLVNKNKIQTRPDVSNRYYISKELSEIGLPELENWDGTTELPDYLKTAMIKAVESSELFENYNSHDFKYPNRRIIKELDKLYIIEGLENKTELSLEFQVNEMVNGNERPYKVIKICFDFTDLSRNFETLSYYSKSRYSKNDRFTNETPTLKDLEIYNRVITFVNKCYEMWNTLSEWTFTKEYINVQNHEAVLTKELLEEYDSLVDTIRYYGYE